MALAIGLAGFLNASCTKAPAAVRNVPVAAASDLQFAFGELAEAFQRQHPEFTIVPTFGASGTLTAQISSGAPFDAFFSADRAYPEKLVLEGHADGSSMSVYAIGHIVLWVPTASPVDVASLGERSLTDPRIRIIAIANPDHAPYGRAAVAAFASLGLTEAVQKKLVFGENVAQAAQFAQSGAADAAVIGRSLAVAPKLANEGRWWEFPPASHPAIEQAAVVTSSAKEPAAARDFIEFVTSAEGRVILERHGLGAP